MDRNHEKLVGNSSAFAMALEHVSRLAAVNRPVLIIGERGTGKELAAERLHFLSNRWDNRLVKVNCAAVSEQLLDSALFGHEAGAFTGATRTHRGHFERANSGTLFLDELATMSMRLQEKLLRLIEYGEFERVGGQQTLKVNVRVVAATNANLKTMAANGHFREDLLDRLSFDVVHLPPLRYRREDIASLANHFAIQMCTELQWEYFAGFTDRALNELDHYPWPGNVRELKNVVERSIHRWGDAHKAVDSIIFDPFISPYCLDSATGTDIAPADLELPTATKATSASVNKSFTQQVQQFERQLLRAALLEQHSHQGRTAKALGLSYHQLRGLLRKYKLKP